MSLRGDGFPGATRNPLAPLEPPHPDHSRAAAPAAGDGGDVFFPDGALRTRVRLRREIAKNGRAGDVSLPDALMPKLRRIWRYERFRRESLSPAVPLFCSRRWRRLPKRRVQVLFRARQVIAGFDRLSPFHALRHTAVTNVYRASRDLYLAQRFARHASKLTAIVHTHVSDEELFERVRDLSCRESRPGRSADSRRRGGGDRRPIKDWAAAPDHLSIVFEGRSVRAARFAGAGHRSL